ncbi:FliH/SctL family protein [Roseateles asaccharophilus]|uniref:Flagellar assembly protein FliH n=1 Tax=Roseateles asaccharophilus TaxID=582607 RepID=A0ABU2ACP2_9BURK|nr:FliH/SctL family protein [Roseateles asaccharophilus]MDR7334972.1 flagellar assembly protein FliH [Roseateles asaccharophilus]
MVTRQPPRQVPPPDRREGERRGSYARFIPGEEVQGAKAWSLDHLGDTPASPFAPMRPGTPAAQPPATAATAAEPPPPPEPDLQEQLHAARQGGYQDGYRDGMAALDAFKHSFAQQVSAQVGQLVKNFDAEMQALEGDMAQTVARIAVELARQVVRSELEQRPELIARVAHDAVEALQLSARHVRVRVHPDDYPLVREGAGTEMQAREAQLIPDPDVARGGVKVDADIASVDATIATRWQQAVSAIGQPAIWEDRRGSDDESL